MDNKLNFDVHIQNEMALLTLYKMFIRLQLNYADIIYDKPNNELSCKIIEIVQYNVRLAITGAIQGTSQEKLDQDLGLESLSDTRWYRKLFFIKSNIISLQHILILICIIIIIQIHLIALDHHKMFKNLFFPDCIKEWTRLDNRIRKAESLSKFK